MMAGGGSTLQNLGQAGDDGGFWFMSGPAIKSTVSFADKIINRGIL